MSRQAAAHSLPDPRDLAREICAVAAAKKATDIRVVDLRPAVTYTDWFVIATGRSVRQAKAVAEGVREALKRDFRVLPGRVEGAAEGKWILLDFGSVVVHVFTPETREHYDLDRLWGDLPAEAIPNPNDSRPAPEAPG